MSSYTYTPFPFNVTPASPLFELSPIGSDLTQGWVPSCFTPECVPTASWATGSIGATLSFQFWGWDVTFDGNVKGNMSVEILRDGVKEIWNPSADTLFSFHGALTDEFYYHSITLKVLDASPNSELIVNQARVNGSTFGGSLDYDRRTWTIPSSDERLIYSGFSEQASVAQEETLITYVSGKAGGKAFMRFNATALLVYGPCGPTSGLMKVTIDVRSSTVNTSVPITSNDCLLFQSWGLPTGAMQELLIEHVGGATLGINRIEFVYLYWMFHGPPSMAAQAVAFALLAVFVAMLIWAALMVSLKRSQGGKIKQMFKALCL